MLLRRTILALLLLGTFSAGAEGSVKIKAVSLELDDGSFVYPTASRLETYDNGDFLAN